ncbi:MAG: hypothetical protein JXA21_11320 [Anaerolineae bacterium]|nr:hypothetical protein [Anaerolineae bacterium]
MLFQEQNEQMALALALSNFGAEWIGDNAQTPLGAWAQMLSGLVECGHNEDQAERIIEEEVREWLHNVEAEEPHALQAGAQLLERFAWA